MADNNTRIVITAQANQAITEMKTLGESVGHLKERIMSLPMLGGALAGVLSVGAMTGAVKGIIDTADELNDLSQKVGVGIKDLVSYKLAAEQSGTSLEAVARGIKGLSSYMVENSKSFVEAGISTKSTQQAMEDLADLFSSMPDGAEKTALAVKLFGKSGMDMIPMLNAGSQALRDSAEKTAKLGALYETLAPQADKFNDSLAEFKTKSSAAGVAIGSELLPPLQVVVDEMVAFKDKSDGSSISLSTTFGSAMKGVIVLGANVAYTLKAMGTEIGGLAAQLAALGRGDFRGFSAIRDLMVKDAEEARRGIDVFTDKILSAESKSGDKQKDVIERSAKSISDARKRARALIGVDKLSGASDPFESLMKQLRGDVAGKQAELAGMQNGDVLTDADKRYAKFLDSIRNGDLKLTNEQIGKAAIQWDKLINADRGVEEAKKAKQAAEDTKRAAEIIRGLKNKFENDNAEKIDALLIMPEIDRDLGKNLRKITEEADRARTELAKMHHLDPGVLADKLAEVDAALKEQIETTQRLTQMQKDLNASWEYGADKALQAYIDSVRNVSKDSEKLFTDAFKGMEDALVKFVQTGKLDFKSLADSIIADLIRIQIRQSMTPLLNSGLEFVKSLFGGPGPSDSGVSGPMSYPDTPEGFMPFPFAKGDVFASADLHQYANTITNSPTLFKFAKGGAFGVFGEAGHEAVMPLTRGPDGNLGVRAHGAQGGGESKVVVNIIESPGNGGRQEQRSENGVKVLDVFVEQIKSSIASDISRGSGAVPAALAGTYALNRVAGAY